MNYTKLRILTVIQSDLKTVVCGEIVTFEPSLKQLKTVDLSHNSLSSLDSSLSFMTSLETLDVSHNKIANVNLSFSSFPHLKSLNLSFNLLKTIPANSLQSVSPTSLSTLDLSQNPWQCDSSLQWIYHWARNTSLGTRMERNEQSLTFYLMKTNLIN